MLEPVVETTEEELFDTSPALFSKLLIRRCHMGSLKENWLSAKTTTKALLKPSFELVALVTLRVPPVLTIALLNLYSIPAEDFLEVEGGFFVDVDE